MTDSGLNRRRTRRRLRLDEHGIVSARVRPGQEVTLLDVSAGGALVESQHRLLPGTSVELHLATRHQHTAVRGRVLRCTVSSLGSASVCYQGAIGFDRSLSWFVDEESTGYLVHSADGRAERPERADATPQVT